MPDPEMTTGSATAWLSERAEVLKALALFEQSLETLSKELRGDIAELRGGLGQVLAEVKARTADVAALQVDYAQRCAQLDSVRLTTGKLVTKQLNLEKSVERASTVVRIVSWVGALIGASIIALIWALITGQAQVVFK